MFGCFKPIVLLNNFTHLPFFCCMEVCQSSCEAAVAQVLVPSLEDQREARQGWWFQLGAVEKRAFFKYFFQCCFSHVFSHENFSCYIFCCCAQAQLDSTRSALLKLMQQLSRKAEHDRNAVKTVMQKVDWTEILGILATSRK